MEKRLVVDIDLPDDFMIGDCVKCPFYKSNSRMWCPFLEKYHGCPLHRCLLNIPNTPVKKTNIEQLCFTPKIEKGNFLGIKPPDELELMNKINEIIDVLNERS